MGKKYLVTKGWEGFCDRLQALSWAVDLSMKFNRILYVDWTDRVWSREGETFYTYFKFKDLEYIDSPKRLPKNAAVWPKFWTKILNNPLDEYIYAIKDQVDLDLDGYHFEDIWVHSGIGHRRWNFQTLAEKLRFNDQTRDQILEMCRDIDVSRPVIHLRGTDRMSGVKVQRWEELLAIQSPYIISDDANLAQDYLTANPSAELVSKTLMKASDGGHRTDDIPYKKHAMNMDLLKDFWLLSRADKAYGLVEESLYWRMARMFHDFDGHKKVME